MRVALILHRHVIFYCAFHRNHVAPRRQPRAVANAENMRIDRLRRMGIDHVQQHIGSFAPHTRQRLKRRARTGDHAAKILDQYPAEFDDVFSLLAKQANGFDMADQRVFTQIEHFLWRVYRFEQGSGGLVYANIGGLGGQRDGNQKREVIYMRKLALRGRLGGRKAGKNL